MVTPSGVSLTPSVLVLVVSTKVFNVGQDKNVYYELSAFHAHLSWVKCCCHPTLSGCPVQAIVSEAASLLRLASSVSRPSARRLFTSVYGRIISGPCSVSWGNVLILATDTPLALKYTGPRQYGQHNSRLAATFCRIAKSANTTLPSR